MAAYKLSAEHQFPFYKYHNLMMLALVGLTALLPVLHWVRRMVSMCATSVLQMTPMLLCHKGILKSNALRKLHSTSVFVALDLRDG